MAMAERRRDRRPVGQGDGPFVFVGEALALELVNTEVIVRGKRHDLLAAPGAVAAWWRAARGHHPHVLPADVPVPPDDVTLHQAITHLRAALRGLFSALADGATPPPEHLATLNAVLDAAHPVLTVRSDGTLKLTYGSPAGAMAPLLPIALSAVGLATGGTRARLHRCANRRCVLLFYDTTKSATRRWCSGACKDRDRKRKQYHRSGDSAQTR
jgi:predicted RNA-binding Zn ribbon-like protein